MAKIKKDESRPVNWHRPLRPGEFTQRYLRNRMAEASEEHLIPPEEYEAYYGSYDSDYYWDVYDPASPADYAIYKTWAHLSEIQGHGQLKAAFERVGWQISGAGESDQNKKIDRNQKEPTPKPTQKIEGHLAKHITRLRDGQFDPTNLPLSKDREDLQIIFDLINSENVSPQILENPDWELFTERFGYHYNRRDNPFLLCLLLSPFWVRSPKTWVRPSDTNVFLHFVSHLFEIYPTPKFLKLEWTVPFSAIRYKWLMFYLIMAQGGSLKKAAPQFEWSIGKQFTKYFLEAPDEVSPVQAAIYSKIMCQGGSIVEFNRITRNLAYIEDPTEASVDAKYLSFWESAVNWLIKNRNQLSDEDADLILEWAMHRYTEDRYNEQRFTWSGRTVENALTASRQYLETRDLPWIELYWRAQDWDWEYLDEYDKNWTFAELTSGKQLYEESKQLHHCVQSYASRCASMNSAIVSVSCNNEKILTIEINPKGKEIVQVKGLQNRFPSAAENNIINTWYTERVLKKE